MEKSIDALAQYRDALRERGGTAVAIHPHYIDMQNNYFPDEGNLFTQLGQQEGFFTRKEVRVGRRLCRVLHRRMRRLHPIDRGALRGPSFQSVLKPRGGRNAPALYGRWCISQDFGTTVPE